MNKTAIFTAMIVAGLALCAAVVHASAWTLASDGMSVQTQFTVVRAEGKRPAVRAVLAEIVTIHRRHRRSIDILREVGDSLLGMDTSSLTDAELVAEYESWLEAGHTACETHPPFLPPVLVP